jgi:hypothetical protein
MASDDTRPKVRMLFTIGVVAVSLLFGVKFLLDSYYLDMTEEHARSLLPATEQIEKLRAEEKAAINTSNAGGNIPVSVAMQQLAQKGRDNAGDVISPKPSDDVDPLKGWSKLKREVHLPPQVTSAAPEAPLPPVGDAGVQTTTAGDAGAPAPGAKDGGAPAAGKDGGAAPHAPQVAKDGGK